MGHESNRTVVSSSARSLFKPGGLHKKYTGTREPSQYLCRDGRSQSLPDAQTSNQQSGKQKNGRSGILLMASPALSFMLPSPVGLTTLLLSQD
jgi:hypothetical protein